jgi:hypothetical protein
LDRRRQAEKTRAAALTPQVTGATVSSQAELGAMDELHARLRMQGTPRTKRSDRRRARELPSTPSLDHFDMSAFASDPIDDDATGLNLADMAAKMLNQLEDGSPTPAPRRQVASQNMTESIRIEQPEDPVEPSLLSPKIEPDTTIPTTPEYRPDIGNLMTPPDKGSSQYPLDLALRDPRGQDTTRADADETVVKTEE